MQLPLKFVSQKIIILDLGMIPRIWFLAIFATSHKTVPLLSLGGGYNKALRHRLQRRSDVLISVTVPSMLCSSLVSYTRFPFAAHQACLERGQLDHRKVFERYFFALLFFALSFLRLF